MGDIVNLNHARKRRARAEAAAEAVANRAKHGRSKAERAREDRVQEAARRLLDGARLSDDPQAPDPVRR